MSFFLSSSYLNHKTMRSSTYTSAYIILKVPLVSAVAHGRQTRLKIRLEDWSGSDCCFPSSILVALLFHIEYKIWDGNLFSLLILSPSLQYNIHLGFELTSPYVNFTAFELSLQCHHRSVDRSLDPPAWPGLQILQLDNCLNLLPGAKCAEMKPSYRTTSHYQNSAKSRRKRREVMEERGNSDEC